MGYFGFVPNESGRIHEHKALVSPCERREHMVSLTAFAVLLLAVIKQCCITASAPFWIGGEFPVFAVRPHAPNREVRDGSVRIHTVPPLIYMYIK